MGVDVDEARRDRQAGGVDFFPAGARDFPHLCDFAVLDRDVADKWRATIAVHDGATAYDDVVFVGHLLGSLFLCRKCHPAGRGRQVQALTSAPHAPPVYRPVGSGINR
jgi:hypothetical protein